MAEIKEKDNKNRDRLFLLKAKTNAAEQLERCEAEISKLSMTLQEKEAQYPQIVQATKKLSEAEEIDRLNDKLIKLQEQHVQLINMRNSVEAELEALKLFKKSTSLSNIRYLLREHPDVKLGQIEAEGNVSTGYTSRLEKPENRTDPPVEYLAAAAKAFNVFIDTLMYAPLDEMTASEKYLLRFIEKVARDTTEEAMIWKREPCSYLNQTVDLELHHAQHRLFVVNEASVDDYGRYHEAFFKSRFFPEKDVEVRPDPYHATMTGTENMLYIVPVMIYNTSAKTVGATSLELYISDDQEVTPICSTLQAHPAVSSAINKLFSLIQETSSHVRLDTKARSLIDAFMNPASQQKKVSEKVTNPYEYEKDDGELPF